MNAIRNDLSASKKKVLIYAFAFVTLISGVGAAFFPLYLEPRWLTTTVAILFGTVLILNLFGNHHYLWVLVENDKLKVRYYSIFSFLRKFQAIEIPLNTFRGYKVKPSLLGLRKELILRQQVKSQTGTYPPVIISTLSNKEYNALIALLNQYSPK